MKHLFPLIWQEVCNAKLWNEKALTFSLLNSTNDLSKISERFSDEKSNSIVWKEVELFCQLSIWRDSDSYLNSKGKTDMYKWILTWKIYIVWIKTVQFARSGENILVWVRRGQIKNNSYRLPKVRPSDVSSMKQYSTGKWNGTQLWKGRWNIHQYPSISIKIIIPTNI